MRVVDLTYLTKTTTGRRKLEKGFFGPNSRKLVLSNARFLCEHVRTGLFVSKLYFTKDKVGPQNLGHGDLYVASDRGSDIGVEELSYLAYLDPYPFLDFHFQESEYTSVWMEDDATRGTPGHVGVTEAFNDRYGCEPIVEQVRDEEEDDMMIEYIRTGQVIVVCPDGSQIWERRSPKHWEARAEA